MAQRRCFLPCEFRPPESRLVRIFISVVCAFAHVMLSVFTWSPYLPPSASELGIEGIPMLWGWGQVDDFKKLVVQGYAQKVFGMNEYVYDFFGRTSDTTIPRPNEPSQSHMSPEDGISLWQQHIDPLKSQGYYLISPACTNDQAGLDWMKSFVEGCTGCTVRFPVTAPSQVTFELYSRLTPSHSIFTAPTRVRLLTTPRSCTTHTISLFGSPSSQIR